MLLFRAASAAACSAGNGGATTISTSVMSLTRKRNSLTYFTASATVLYIFQLPAMKGVLMAVIQNAKCKVQTLTVSKERGEHRRIFHPVVSRQVPFAFCILNVAFQASGKAATPGSVCPPRNSSEAPPPVEMCVMRSVTPAFATAAMESPPPTMVVPLTSATASATAIVPCANASISKTPIGPFQTTVLASRRACVYAETVTGQ